MDAGLTYAALLLGAVAVPAAALALARPVERACPRCGDKLPCQTCARSVP